VNPKSTSSEYTSGRFLTLKHSDDTINAINSGAGILTHSIKNVGLIFS